MTTSSLPVVALRPIEKRSFRSKAIFKYRKTCNEFYCNFSDLDCDKISFAYLPFFPKDNLAGKRYVEIQLQKMIGPDVDAVHFEHQMRY